MKKIIIIIIAVVFILAVAFGVYFGWKKSKEILEPPISNQQSIIDNQQQTAAKQRLKIIGNQPAFGYWINSIATSSQIFYFNQDGQIFKIKADGVDLIVKNLLDPKQKTQKILSLSQKDFDLKWIASD